MGRYARPGSGSRSIRNRLLAIAWIPSLTLLLAGLVVSIALARNGAQGRAFGTTLQRLSGPSTSYYAAVERERRLTMLLVADPSQVDRSQLEAARTAVNTATAATTDSHAGLVKYSSPALRKLVGGSNASREFLDPFRKQVDAHQSTLTQVDGAYSQILVAFNTGFYQIALIAPDPKLALDQLSTAQLLSLSDWVSHADALADVATRSPGLNEQQYAELTSLVGSYRQYITTQTVTVPGLVTATLSGNQQQALRSLSGTAAWEEQEQVMTALLHTPPDTGTDGQQHYKFTPPVSQDSWSAAENTVSDTLNEISAEQYTQVATAAHDHGRSLLLRALGFVLLVLLLSILVFTISTRLATQLTDRLRRLRDYTLDLAERRLPDIVERLRRGEQVDVAAEMNQFAPAEREGQSPDEIGEVADAFGQAQQTAVAAAAGEAETRAGTREVFLNIARRSQVIVHRQLRLLDQAERGQDDPDQLNLLFELDHLATRARRNAENLIIMGGGTPARQWRQPVPLVQVVRSAIGESERYVRVTTGELPSSPLDGSAVADVIHLIAELVDNATNFSPPTSRVEVRGNAVGRGVAIEIEDQGLGMASDLRDSLNAMLHEPPDFSMMALSEEPRLGLFVVARLAAEHGIRVTLAESPYYGGTRAIVLIPNSLLGPSASVAPETGESPVMPMRPLPPATPPAIPAPSNGRPAPGPDRREAPPPPAHRAMAPAPPDPTMTSPAGLSMRTPPAGGLTGGSPNSPGNGRTAGGPVDPDGPRQIESRRPANQPAPTEGRPALPQRVRQANLVPQLAEDIPSPEPDSSVAGAAPADRVRSRYASLQRGSRRGRSAPATDHPGAANSEGQHDGGRQRGQSGGGELK